MDGSHLVEGHKQTDRKEPPTGCHKLTAALMRSFFIGGKLCVYASLKAEQR
jgi:hypothetical protein